MPKYRFKDDKMTFSDIMDIFEKFEDDYAGIVSEIIFDENHVKTFAEELQSIILDCNEETEMSSVEMYDEEKNGAIVFTLRSKYKCLRTIKNTRIKILNLFSSDRFISYLEDKLLRTAKAYLEALEYFFTYSYMVRDEVKQELNSKYGYFKQPLKIKCDGEDAGV